MKSIKILIIVIGLFISSISEAQTWSIADPVVGTLKGTMNTNLATDNGLTIDQNIAVGLLKAQEDDYNERRGFDIYAIPIKTFTIQEVEKTLNIAKDVNLDIENIQTSNLFFRHGIRKLDSDLQKETSYLKEIEEDYIMLTANEVLGGGSGYSYTAVLKVLLRTLKVRRNILDIQMKVNNLNTANKIFEKD